VVLTFGRFLLLALLIGMIHGQGDHHDDLVPGQLWPAIQPLLAQPTTPLRRARSHRRPRLPGRHRRPAAHRDGCPRRLARPHYRLDDPVGPPVEALVHVECVL
jgi:hypothetical protein